ncbi:protein BTG4 [Clupea harengus]|uniref:Protein BTG4 n=1 Tax=Clupea harengus TaxID=7950 RepID=A0A6P3VJE9_CLUHA|nr:protein BTG4 [Clupea harengus]
MKEEIAATVFFMARLAQKYGKLNRIARDTFALSLTSVLFEKFRNHWYPSNPSKGQAFRCLRVNKFQIRDPDIEQACRQSDIDFDDLGLPSEMTIWVDPGEVSCRYGEKSTPFCVTQLEGPKCDGDFSRRINNAVERASSDYHSGTSSDEEGDSIISNISSNISGNMSGNISSSIGSSISSINCSSNSSCLSAPEQKTIPTVSNPNSVYQISEFGPPLQSWNPYPKRKPFPGDGYQQHGSSNGSFPQHKSFKNYRPSFAFSGPRVDKYHWVSKNRS